MIEDRARRDSVLDFFHRHWSVLMRREFALALIAILPGTLAAAQQAAPPTSSVAAPPSAQTVYYAGPGVAAPESPTLTLDDPATGRCDHMNGIVSLSAIVDAAGFPSHVYFLKPTGKDLDGIAVKVVTAERFKPGRYNGAPVATIVAIELRMEACIKSQKNGEGQKDYILKLRSPPNQKLDLERPPYEGTTLTLSSSAPSQPGETNTAPDNVHAGISAPVLIKPYEATYSDKARRERITGVCVVSLTVDAHGMPQHLSIVKSLEPGLDQNALYAASRYRFKPAMKKDGTPVAVYATVEVRFHLY